jgi:hypothetical protein
VATSHLGRRLRTVFLCDYFLNDGVRREQLHALNRGEAVDALKRAIYSGRVASHQAKRRGGAVPPELIGSIARTRTEGINLRGVFRFPVGHYAEKILPSVTAEKAMASAE